MDKKTIVFIVIIVLFSSIMLFVSGYYIHSLLATEGINNSSNMPKQQNENDDTSYDENESTSFSTGKNYFEDTIILISKTEPHYTLVATASRSGDDDTNYIQGTRISFFDGNKWSRIIRNDTNSNSSIKNNEFVENWTINYDESKVLKQKVSGQLNINTNKVGFDSQILENEIGIRSLPGYTKFMSEGDGTMTINNDGFESYVLYTRIYSLNSSELFKYDGNVGLETDWVAFWDNSGNFYHIDSTNVKEPALNYQTHSIAVLKNSLGSVLKTFSISINKDQNDPPLNYSIQINAPINKFLTFTKYNDINKAPNNSYSWHMGNIKNENGIGLVEYILK